MDFTMLKNQKLVKKLDGLIVTIIEILADKSINELKVRTSDDKIIYLRLAIEKKNYEFLDEKMQKEFLEAIDENDNKERQRAVQIESNNAEAIKIAKEREIFEDDKPSSKRIGRRGSNKPYVRKDRKNIAYKATFCDGNGNWFANPCSKTCREYNCSRTARAEFCKTNSVCKKVVDGLVSESEIDKARNTNLLCYESRLLTDYRVYAGRHNDNRPIGWELDKDRLVVFTTVLPGSSEEGRIIFGAMLVEHSYEKTDESEACVTAYPDYRISLSQEEAEQMPYWNYAPGEGGAKNLIQWNEKLWRYQSDETCATILRDLVQLVSKRGKEDAEKAQAFLKKFLDLISLKEEDIPEKSGPLA